jgi:hypothetical protein
MTDLECAQHAKIALRAMLNPEGKPGGAPSWLRGIGIGFDETGRYCVKVNVQAMTNEIWQVIPATLGSVPVVVDVVGDIYPQKP